MRPRPISRAALTATVVLTPVLVSCSQDAPSVLDPAGPGARRIAGLWWVLFWISVVVLVVVTALIVMAVRRRGTSDLEVDRNAPRLGNPFILWAGVVIPALILTGTFVYAMVQTNELSTAGQETDMTITVEAQNWWWEVRYPNGAVTANELHIPVGEPVRIELTSPDVVHSFWVPRLQAKVDHIPGTTNEIWLEADEAGRYRGQCAEFCGLQHAHMEFYVFAEPREQFEEWLANEAAPAAEPQDAGARTGEEVFMDSTCVGCHAIRGTEADAEIGPDLTHLAARTTIGAGKLTNTRANLERFIIDPQGVKPGIAMPPTELDDDELDALLDYLESLD